MAEIFYQLIFLIQVLLLILVIMALTLHIQIICILGGELVLVLLF